jgi:hypothetical protein
MFDTLFELLPRDGDYPQRVWRLDLLKRAMDGSLYDLLPYHFHEERSASGEYIPLRQRKPSVRYPLCKIVVEDSVSLLFSEGHFPTIDSVDENVRVAFANIVKETHLNMVMIEAAVRGSIGSIALLLRVLDNRLFIDIIDTAYLTPNWDPLAPDRLASVEERYKVSGADLVRSGYLIEDRSQQYWFVRRWDTEREVWYLPFVVNEPDQLIIDHTRTVIHHLGLVPRAYQESCVRGHNQPGDGLGETHDHTERTD